MERGIYKNHSYYILDAFCRPVTCLPWGEVGITCIGRRDGRLSRVSLYLTFKDNKIEGHGKERSRSK